MNQPGFNESCHVDGLNLDVAHLSPKNPSESLSPVSDRTRKKSEPLDLEFGMHFKLPLKAAWARFFFRIPKWSEQRVTIRLKSTWGDFFQRNETSDSIYPPANYSDLRVEVNPKW